MPTNPVIGRVEQAIQDIVKAYKGLKRTAGFRFTVKTVSRKLHALEDLETGQRPAIFVYRPPGESDRTMNFMDSGASGGYLNRFRLDLLGAVGQDAASANDETLPTLGENFLSDIRALQMKDCRFGSSVIADSTLLPGGGNDGAFDSEWTSVLQPLLVDVNVDINGTHLP